MSNLITNAIKYSPNDSRIKIRAEIARDPNFLEVTVEDNGMGIAPEHQKMIFERFYRIENQVHTVKGTGLGLHLVKIAIEKHHQGQVFVKSKLNEGSTFGFWLPIEKSNIKTSKQTENKFSQVQGEYQKINIEKLEDYSTKAQIDAQYIGQDIKQEQKEVQEDDFEKPLGLVFDEINGKTNNPIKKDTLLEQATRDTGWEISFEVRDN